MTQPAGPKPADRLPLFLLAALTAVYLGLFGYFLPATVIRVPVYDLLGWIMHYADFWLRGDWWGYLWVPHNEHRIVFTRLLLVADIDWFRGTTLPFILFGLLCLGAMIGSILRVSATADLPPGLAATLELVVILLLATTYIGVDCTMPALGVYVQTAAFAVLALVLLTGAGEGERWVGVRRTLALVAGIAAGFGIAGGLLIWPVLLWAAWRGGLGRGWLLAVTLTGGAFITAYVPGLHSHGALGPFDLLRLVRMLDYAIRFLGLPWSHAEAFVWFGRFAGGFVLIAGLFVLATRGLMGPRPTRLERLAIGMVFFALLMAALAGVGRVDIATDREMPIRYSVFTAMAQLGLLLSVAPWLARQWLAPRRRRLLQVGSLVLAALLLVQQELAGRAGARVAEQYADAYRRFAAGEWTPDMERFVHPDRQVAEQGLVLVRHLGIYQSY